MEARDTVELFEISLHEGKLTRTLVGIVYFEQYIALMKHFKKDVQLSDYLDIGLQGDISKSGRRLMLGIDGMSEMLSIYSLVRLEPVLGFMQWNLDQLIELENGRH